MTRRLVLALAMLAAMLAPAVALELEGPTVQGALVTGRVAPGASVSVDGRQVRVSDQGRFVFGLGRDHGAETVLEVVRPDGTRERHRFEVASRSWDIERIDGLPSAKVSPPAETLARIRREAALISAARAQDTPAQDFLSGLDWPVSGRISGRYGNQRILNGEPRRPHLGVDIAAPEGTPVRASAPGRVVLAERDLFYTGGTVVIDHGHGITSIYSHLASLAVASGDEVSRGAPVGTVGSTGRSTGPHLDWRINWFDERLDPELIAGPPPD